MRYLSLTFLLLIGLNYFVWELILGNSFSGEQMEVYFLDVGQGDSELIILPDGAKIVIDSGPGKGVSFELGEIFSPIDRYIDLIAITHAQKDHFGGFIDLLSRYRVGAVLWNGEDSLSEEWLALKNLLLEKEVPILKIKEGDKIKQGETTISILNPNKEMLDKPNANEGSLVMMLEGENIKALFTGDVSIDTENVLLDKYDLNIDLLKVAHHGSKYSTGISFLEKATPAISIIEVGGNRYGHPTAAVLQRLQMVGSSIYRTDKNGTIKVVVRDGVMGVKVDIE
ncbi:MAG: hypothetical protein COT89_01005 [Candidatus Colwellbacteria bacterium CG10_big_fil_rev_8_21_14_0_10_42_22]|uniref:Metallo-beta-lactamase domain-containing protein n=1 Tax=Candidatus Colwellbacteria bacterium CG10_big_fil_rev_8_21_14_0_10_42_22 TaxID=1974540 RepID=A0A2H0VG91_9BACT|nr:MAG: hypothetical protein COT89_01005 [Candidatus Colwellbacteria bacterium CG10_big_fil_rev_8_21_14_0_10_42_22]